MRAKHFFRDAILGNFKNLENQLRTGHAGYGPPEWVLNGSVSMIEARAYLGIDGTDHDIYLTGMRRESERRVRRLTIVGDMVDDTGVYTHQFPSDLQPAQADHHQMDV